MTQTAKSPTERRKRDDDEAHTSQTSSSSRPDRCYRPLAEYLSEARTVDSSPRIPLGLPGIDEALGGGVRPGWTVAIGGYAGVAKTSILARMARSLPASDVDVLVCSLEIGAVGFAMRTLPMLPPSATSYPGPGALDVLAVESTDAGTLAEHIGSWAADRPGRRCAVLLDYAQRVTVPEVGSREREVASACERLQAVAIRTGAVLVMAAQLSRAAARSEGGPELVHYRESGLIEQVADVALLLSRQGDALRVRAAKCRWGGDVGRIVEYRVDWPTMRLEVVGSLASSGQCRTGRARGQGNYHRVVEALWGVKGDLSTTDIAGHTGIRRTTVQSILERLVEEGSVLARKEGRRSVYRAVQVSVRTHTTSDDDEKSPGNPSSSSCPQAPAGPSDKPAESAVIQADNGEATS